MTFQNNLKEFTDKLRQKYGMILSDEILQQMKEFIFNNVLELTLNPNQEKYMGTYYTNGLEIRPFVRIYSSPIHDRYSRKVSVQLRMDLGPVLKYTDEGISLGLHNSTTRSLELTGCDPSVWKIYEGEI